MALSEQEREWLERRKRNEKKYGSVYCPYCDQFIAERDEYIGHCYDDLYCPLTDYVLPDVVEFEARVAVLLTDRDDTYIPPCHIVCSHYRNCRECRMMYARLAVEAEMEAKR